MTFNVSIKKWQVTVLLIALVLFLTNPSLTFLNQYFGEKLRGDSIIFYGLVFTIFQYRGEYYVGIMKNVIPYEVVVSVVAIVAIVFVVYLYREFLLRNKKRIMVGILIAAVSGSLITLGVIKLQAYLGQRNTVSVNSTTTSPPNYVMLDTPKDTVFETPKADIDRFTKKNSVFEIPKEDRIAEYEDKEKHLPLSTENKEKLHNIIVTMVDKKAPDVEIKAVITDFKRKYGKKEKPIDLNKAFN